MSDELNIPAIPNSKEEESKPQKKQQEGDLDHMLDVDLGDGTFGETRRAIAGLTGDWKPGSYSLSVDWNDPATYDESWDGDWDDAILLDDDY